MQLVEARRSADPRRSARHPAWRSAAPAAPAWSAGCRAASSFWRCRLCAGVSPVRVSMRDRQAHLADRLAEVALDVDGQRLQRRDVERVDAAMRLARLALRPRRRDRSASAGSRPASCRRRSARSAAPIARPAPWPAARSDGRAATSRAPRTSSGTVREDGGGVLGRRGGLAASRVRGSARHRRQAKSGTKRDQFRVREATLARTAMSRFGAKRTSA